VSAHDRLRERPSDEGTGQRLALPAASPGAARIVAFGHYSPKRVVTNDELAARVDTSDTWIRSRVGIVSRRIAGPDESVVDMAVAAGGKAMAAAGLVAGDIDLVIVSTCTTESQVPGASAQVAHRLGLNAPGTFDLNGACAGFCYALAMAANAIAAGTSRGVLVIAAERLSDWTDWGDRSTCVLFADGAGAAVVRAGNAGGGGEIGPVTWGSAGGLAGIVGIADRNSFLRQDGQLVYQWAITALPPVAMQACERAGVAPTDLAAIVLHQANMRIIKTVTRSLDAPQALVADDIAESGNTSSASIPLALSRMVEQGRLRPGERVLLLGFGGGLTYAGMVITIP
jgi:3-oxoacyl-[acyl-carrier-protein] synthase III